MASIAIQSENSDGNEEKVDEIDKFVNSRFVTTSESYWRICGFDMHGRNPSIQ